MRFGPFFVHRGRFWGRLRGIVIGIVIGILASTGLRRREIRQTWRVKEEEEAKAGAEAGAGAGAAAERSLITDLRTTFKPLWDFMNSTAWDIIGSERSEGSKCFRSLRLPAAASLPFLPRARLPLEHNSLLPPQIQDLLCRLLLVPPRVRPATRAPHKGHLVRLFSLPRATALPAFPSSRPTSCCPRGSQAARRHARTIQSTPQGDSVEGGGRGHTELDESQRV